MGSRSMTGQQGDDLDVKLAAVETRVGSLSQEQHRLNNTVMALQAQMQSGFDSIRSAIAAKSEPQYTLIISLVGVGLSICVAIGTLAYIPIKAAQDDMKTQILALDKDTSDKIKRLWDSHAEARRRVDYLDGQLHPLTR